MDGKKWLIAGGVGVGTLAVVKSSTLQMILLQILEGWNRCVDQMAAERKAREEASRIQPQLFDTDIIIEAITASLTERFPLSQAPSPTGGHHKYSARADGTAS